MSASDRESDTWNAEPAGATHGTIAPEGEPVGERDRRPGPALRYEELGAIGQGGMGRVLLVRDREMRREVALKEMSAGTAASTRAVQRFLREARITAQLEHPGVIPVYELGRRPDGTPYYTMKRIRGRTLRDALNASHGLAGRLDLFDHFVDLCHAVAYAHSNGVSHRDLKPENVMIGAFGETVVMDWGLVHVASPDGVTASTPPEDSAASAPPPAAPPPRGTDPAEPAARIDSGDELATAHGAVLGTPQYMSPEQARGHGVGPASDVWSLGVMLHELLYGHPPRVPTNGAQVKARALAGGWAPPVTHDEPVPEELVAVLMRALTFLPADRYADAGALVEDLEAWRRGQRVGAYRYSTAEVILRWVRRHRYAVGTTVAATFIVLMVAAYAFREVSRERDLAERALVRATSEALLAKARESVLLRRPDRAVGYLLGGIELAAGDRTTFLSELASAQSLLASSRVLTEPGERTVAVWGSSGGELLHAALGTGDIVRWGADGRPTVLAHLEGEIVGVQAMEGRDMAVAYTRPAGSVSLHATVLRGAALTPSAAFVLGVDAVKSSRISDSGRVLVVEDSNGVLEVWDLDTARRLSTQPADEYLRYALLGDTLLATCSPMRSESVGITVVSVDSGELVARLTDLGGRCRRVYAAGAGLVAESYTKERLYWADPVGAPPTWRAESDKSEDAYADIGRDLLMTDWRDGRLTVQRLSTGATLWETQRDHRDASFRFSTTGSPRIATLDATRISVLDAETGRLVGAVPMKTAASTQVAFLADGRLATLAPTGELRAWSAVEEGVSGVIHEREGAQVVSVVAEGGAVRVADIFTLSSVPAEGPATVLAAVEDKVPCAIAAGPSGTLDILWANRCRAGELDMGFGSGSGLTLARHAADGGVLVSVDRPDPLGASAAVEGVGGGRAASIGDGDCIITLALDGSAPRRYCTEGRRFVATALAADGQLLAGGDAHAVTIWDTRTGDAVAVLPVEGGVDRLAWVPGGRSLGVVGAGRLYVAAVGSDGAWGIADRRALSPVSPPVAWSADGTRLAAATRAGGIVESGPAGGQVFSEGAPERPFSLAFSPDGAWLAVGREGGRVQVFDLETGGLLVSTLLDTRLVLALGWAVDGATLYAGGDDGAVYTLPVRGPAALLSHAQALTNLRLCAESLELVPSTSGSADPLACRANVGGR